MSNKFARLIALLMALSLIAAACGSSSDGDSASDSDADTGSALSTDSDDEEEEVVAEAEEEAEEEAAEEEEAEEAEVVDESADNPAVAEVNGNSAGRFYDAINNPVGPADDSLEPVVITMSNMEGTPGVSFPEIREGFEIAVAQINNELGGINGRPIEFESCAHEFDPNAAINCANEFAELQPNLNVNGIQFFTPAMYPTFIGANVPTIQTVPIFVADFTQPEVISVWGGCPVAFPGAATYTMETLGLTKTAVLYANTPPGIECYEDTEERFWSFLQDESTTGQTFEGFADVSSDPSDDDATVQAIIEYFGDTPSDETGIFFGISAADCNGIMSAITASGVETNVIGAGSCIDDSVLANPASTGATFGQQGYISERADLYDDYIAWELTWRNDHLENSPLRNAPVSAFLRVGHSTGLMVWEIFNDMIAAGEDIDDADSVVAAMQNLENQHMVGTPPVTCTDNTPEFPAVCKKTITYTLWNGESWELGPLNGELINVGDIQGRVAEGNPRETE
ncbi:MAG: branched-chain amino acid transport system substrate-binding protein [Acidimicrobiales bacterium]|jgi:branched-chain amino acid transport system substrate-binding protein